MTDPCATRGYNLPQEVLFQVTKKVWARVVTDSKTDAVGVVPPGTLADGERAFWPYDSLGPP